MKVGVRFGVTLDLTHALRLTTEPEPQYQHLPRFPSKHLQQNKSNTDAVNHFPKPPITSDKMRSGELLNNIEVDLNEQVLTLPE